MTSLPRDALPGQLGQSRRDEAVVEHRVDLTRLGQRVRQDDAGRVRAEARARACATAAASAADSTRHGTVEPESVR